MQTLTAEQFQALTRGKLQNLIAFVAFAPAAVELPAPVRAPVRVRPRRRKSKALFARDQILHRLRQFRTAEQLAEDLGVSKGTAHRYVNALLRAKLVDVRAVRQGKRGPKSVSYRAATTVEIHPPPVTH